MWFSCRKQVCKGNTVLKACSASVRVNLLELTAIVLVNQCVSCIMNSQNEEAEELMKKIEREEETVENENPDQELSNPFIANLITGTLKYFKGEF